MADFTTILPSVTITDEYHQYVISYKPIARKYVAYKFRIFINASGLISPVLQATYTVNSIRSLPFIMTVTNSIRLRKGLLCVSIDDLLDIINSFVIDADLTIIMNKYAIKDSQELADFINELDLYREIS